MQRLFEVRSMFDLPDRTRVAPVLNAWDTNERELPLDRLDGASIAVGEIAPGVTSKPHLHPFVSQVTWVITGELHVRMKNLEENQPYALKVPTGSAVVTEPLTLFQLINPSETVTVRVLYVVIPAFIFETGRDGYNDAVVLDESWDQLMSKDSALVLPNIESIRKSRAAAIERIRRAKSEHSVSTPSQNKSSSQDESP